MKKYFILIIFILIISVGCNSTKETSKTKNNIDCSSLETSGERIKCFTDFAVAEKNSSLCISIYNEKNPENFMKIYGLYDSCVVDVAVSTNNPTLCPNLGGVIEIERCYIELGKKDPYICDMLEVYSQKVSCFDTIIGNNLTVCDELGKSKPGQCCGYLCDKECAKKNLKSEGGSGSYHMRKDEPQTCTCDCDNNVQITIT